MDRLKDKIAIVTGAASGIGRASAELFAAEGARVLAVDRPGSDLTFKGAGITALAADLTEADAPARIIGAVTEAHGGLDILYNNAGVSNSTLAQDMTDEAFDRVLAVNLRAVFRLTREATPLLVRSAAGRILNTASVMALGTDYGLVSEVSSGDVALPAGEVRAPRFAAPTTQEGAQ